MGAQAIPKLSYITRPARGEGSQRRLDVSKFKGALRRLFERRDPAQFTRQIAGPMAQLNDADLLKAFCVVYDISSIEFVDQLKAWQKKENIDVLVETIGAPRIARVLTKMLERVPEDERFNEGVIPLPLPLASAIFVNGSDKTVAGVRRDLSEPDILALGKMGEVHLDMYDTSPFWTRGH